ncbi:hypothetical protein LCGC14_2895700, partial [marine sediment metagenome]
IITSDAYDNQECVAILDSHDEFMTMTSGNCEFANELYEALHDLAKGFYNHGTNMKEMSVELIYEDGEFT